VGELVAGRTPGGPPGPCRTLRPPGPGPRPHSPGSPPQPGQRPRRPAPLGRSRRQYQTATLCAPGWIEPALNLGNLFDRQSRFAEAATCLDTLSHKPAADWRVFSALGRARSMLGDTAAARDAYARALALNPRAPRPTAATCIT
jgi:hypothetical protein